MNEKGCEKRMKLLIFFLTAFCSFSFPVIKNYSNAKSFVSAEQNIYVPGEFSSAASVYAAVVVKPVKFISNCTGKIQSDLGLYSGNLASLKPAAEITVSFAPAQKETYTIGNKFIQSVIFLQTLL